MLGVFYFNNTKIVGTMGSLHFNEVKSNGSLNLLRRKDTNIVPLNCRSAEKRKLFVADTK